VFGDENVQRVRFLQVAHWKGMNPARSPAAYRYRREVRARGHLPTEQAALKRGYLATRALDLTGRGRARWAMRWKPALNAFAITFEGRIVPSTTN
jgi:transposase-like protein